jgi:hypothetical protein
MCGTRCLRAARWALFCLSPLLLLLQGCIGVESTLRIAADGSGTVTLDYRISQFVTKLGTAQGERGKIPLPVTADDFREAVSRSPGVALVGEVRTTEDEDDIHVQATLRFDRIESLSEVPGLDTMPIALTREGETWTLRQVITAGANGGPIDAESREMVQALFGDYALTFVVEAPAAVRSASLGVVSGRTVRYSVAMADLLAMDEQTVLEVVW